MIDFITIYLLCGLLLALLVRDELNQLSDHERDPRQAMLMLAAVVLAWLPLMVMNALEGDDE